MPIPAEAARRPSAPDHVAAAERICARIEDLPDDVRARPLSRIGIIGAGTMGSGIALAFLTADLDVTLIDASEAALERGRAHIQATLQRQVAKARISAEAAHEAMLRLTLSIDFDALADRDLIIEAAFEDIDVKLAIFRRLDATVRRGAILATNTSYLDIDRIAAATTRPDDVVGLHFFSPANIMKLVEVVRGAATAPDVLATAIELALRIGKIPVVARVCHGFIGNRMLAVRRRHAEAMLLEGATPEQIDRVHTGFGMPMGPFRVSDLAGVDVGWHRDPHRIDSIREALCAEGRLGQKAGAGFYDYDVKGQALPSPATQAIIERFRARHGIAARPIGDEEIIVRTLYTMINEGLAILDEGIAQRASDIDVVWLHGYGWPRDTGGPIYWAETIGLGRIAEGLDRYGEALGRDFAMARSLAQLGNIDA